jgi:alkaline phosphatase
MSVPTITASRIFKGQQLDKLKFGEEASLHMDTFPYTGCSKTYCANSQVADSACSSTAYLGGVKGNYATLGVTPAVQKGDCFAQSREENQVSSVLAWAQVINS